MSVVPRLRVVSVSLAVLVVGLLAPSRVAAQEVVEFYALDAIGSVRVVFDQAGAVKARSDYGPFGDEITASTVGAKSFAGLFKDGEAALDYAQARMYQGRTGRFSTADPVYAGVFEPQAWNRYSYGQNGPHSLTDPTGLLAQGPGSLCSAEFSFGQCGGDSMFWNSDGGGGFGFESATRLRARSNEATFPGCRPMCGKGLNCSTSIQRRRLRKAQERNKPPQSQRPLKSHCQTAAKLSLRTIRHILCGVLPMTSSTRLSRSRDHRCTSN